MIYLASGEGPLDSSGRTTGYWVQTSFFGTPLLLTVLLKFCIETRSFVWPTVVAILLSAALNTISIMTVEYFGYSSAGTGVISHVSSVYYLLCILIPVICNIPDLALLMYVASTLTFETEPEDLSALKMPKLWWRNKACSSSRYRKSMNLQKASRPWKRLALGRGAKRRGRIKESRTRPFLDPFTLIA